MASKITICNQSLTMLGVNRISSFDELSPQAEACANLWDSVRDSVQRMGAFDCCIKRLELTPMEISPAFGYAFQFAVPADCLRVLSITNDGRQANYQIEGQELHTNEGAVYLRYVARIEDAGLWDAGLCDVMAVAMAAELAYPLAREQAPAMRQEYMRRRLEHGAIDAQQGTVMRIPSGAVINKRGMF